MKAGIIAHDFPSVSRPTLGVFIREQVDRLAGRMDVEVIAPSPNGRWLRERNEPVSPFGYPVHRPFVPGFPRWFRQSWYPASMALTLGRFRGLAEGCNVVHAHYAFPEAGAVSRAFGGLVPLVVTVHGSDINHFAARPHLQQDIAASLNSADAVVCVSPSLEKKVRALGVETPTTVIPNGVDSAVFHPGVKVEAVRALGLTPAVPRCLFVGNFVPVKGLGCLIDAMTTVAGRIHGTELVLAGARDPRERRHWETVCRRAGIGGNTRIVERVPHDRLGTWYAASDVVVLPSRAEGFGVVLIEALACGVPVVATRCGGPEYIVGDGDGVLVPVGDAAALAGGIIDVLEHRDRYDADVLSSRAVDRFSFESVIDRLMSLYTSLAG